MATAAAYEQEYINIISSGICRVVNGMIGCGIEVKQNLRVFITSPTPLYGEGISWAASQHRPANFAEGTHMAFPLFFPRCCWVGGSLTWFSLMSGLAIESGRRQECYVSQRSGKIARFMGPTWGPPGDDRTQVGPMLAPWSWTLLSGVARRNVYLYWKECKLCMRLNVAAIPLLNDTQSH